MPNITSRDYAGPQDLRAMQALVQATWTRAAHLHIGDLVWQRYPRAASPDWPTRLWFDGDETVAWSWAWSEADTAADANQFYLVVHPRRPELFDQALDWVEGVSHGPVLGTIAFEHDAPLVRALARRGYRPRTHGPFGLHMFRSLNDIDEPVLPAGFTAVSMVELGDVAAKVAGHRAAWSRLAAYDPLDPPLVSGVTFERYRDMMQTWPYRPDLDIGIRGPDGRIVASCATWLDEVNGVALFEPVGVDPAFRRMGLSRAMCLAALNALRAAGATLATVKPRGDPDYPVPRQAYRSMGFDSEGRQLVYERR
ncbi:MAG: GNAT family N-acetyltransferase [Caulobacteraceae bacterium]